MLLSLFNSFFYFLFSNTGSLCQCGPRDHCNLPTHWLGYHCLPLCHHPDHPHIWHCNIASHSCTVLMTCSLLLPSCTLLHALSHYHLLIACAHWLRTVSISGISRKEMMSSIAHCLRIFAFLHYYWTLPGLHHMPTVTNVTWPILTLSSNFQLFLTISDHF